MEMKMKTPFYINPDVLEKPWVSKHDILVMVLFVVALIGANLTYVALTKDSFSPFFQFGIGGAYIGILFGVILHLGKQIKRGDEFASRIIATSTAQAGLFTILFVALITVIHAVRDIGGLGSWNLVAPVLFVFMSYLNARILVRAYL